MYLKIIIDEVLFHNISFKIYQNNWGVGNLCVQMCLKVLWK